MLPFLRSLWSEPRPVPPVAPARWDRALAALAMVGVVAEALLRTGIELRALHVVVGGTLVLPLAVRRAHPLRAFAVSFGVAAAAPLVAALLGHPWTDLHTSALILLLPYSLFRWGSGREATAGLAGLVAIYAVTMTVGKFPGLEDAVGGAVVMLFPAIVGAAVRFRDSARLRELEAARLGERARIARELHDSVAHHLSAIALQAQGGIYVAETRPEEGIKVLHVIEEVAAVALGELRTMVTALRDEGDPALAPQPRIEDLRALAARGNETLRLSLEIAGEVDDASSPIQAAVFRIAQEGITNARRHAKGASAVDVSVLGDRAAILVRVTDDGEGAGATGEGRGFGLVGMAERAALLGGTFHAGPLSERGWRVEARIPLRRAK